ncbi:MAG: hypothetical protein AB8G11_18610 [Saprospiraceae bacterium]
MNKLQSYQSQIVTKNDDVIIQNASSLQRFLQKYQLPIGLTLFITPIFIAYAISNPLIALLSFILFFPFYGIKYLLQSDITITKEFIKSDNHTLILGQIPYLDIQTKVLENKAKVKIGNIRFELQNVADLAILTDIITKKTNLEFYENYELSDKSHVITYKAKRIKTPIFSTFITVQNTKDTIRIYDITSQSQFRWLEINKTQNTNIQWSQPSGDNDYIISSVAMSKLERLQVIIENRPIVINQFRKIRVNIIGLERVQSKSAIAKFQDRLYGENSPYKKHYIFASNLRSVSDELTNLRDGEKVYDLLKNLPSLKNIEVEKIINNT